MGEHDFQTEVLDRLARIETQQTMMYDQFKSAQHDLDSVNDIASKAMHSTQSAHHRLNEIKTDVLIIGGIISFFVTLIFRLWGR